MWCPEARDTAVNYYFYSTGVGAIGISTFNTITAGNRNVLQRFRNVFDLAYQRYMDISHAEEQARESLVQLALERVRARTMAMQQSEELPDAANTLFLQVQALGIPAWSAGYCIWDEDKKAAEACMSSEGVIQKPFKIPITGDPSFVNFYDAYRRGDTFYVEEIGGEALVSHYRFMRTLPVLGEVLDGIINAGFPLPTFQIVHVTFFSQGYLLFITYERVPEAHEIFKRFTQVFEQTYTRFLDLQKAEAQAREAQIEAALERTRTQSMVMQHSNELDITLRVFHEQVLLLGIHSAFSFLWLPDEDKNRHLFWAAWAENVPIDTIVKKDSTVFKSKAIEYPLDRNEPATAQCLVDWKGKEPVVSYQVPPDGVAGYFAAWQELIAGAEQLKPEYFSEGLYYVEAFMKYGCFGVMIKSGLSGEEKKILWRFAIEFERAYTRFLDLQKAEAQAREAQIEAALERVRSRSMGMQKSDELKEVIQVVFEQFVHLNIHVEHSGFVMDYKAKDDYDIWVADPLGVPAQLTIPYFDAVYYNRFNEAKEKGEDFFATNLSFEEKNRFYEKLFEYIPGLPEEAKKFYFSCPGLAASTVLLENIGLYIENFSGIPYSNEENATLMRFGKVFQQTYTRFLDLQKAEAQARESKIEAALEKVRARTMGMQRSEELPDTALLLFRQLQVLDVNLFACSFNIWDDDKMAATSWGAREDGIASHFKTSSKEDVFVHIHAAAQRGESLFVREQAGEELEAHYRYLMSIPEVKPIAEELFKNGLSFPSFQIMHCAFFSQGYLLFISYELVTKEYDMFKRFAKVFEQTYTRFLDLQKAEAQARESKIETALEKVRSRTMAMQRSEELAEVATVLFQQVKTLGVPQWTCGFSIFEIDDKDFTWFPGSADGDILPPVKIPLTEHPVFISFNESRKRGDELFIYEKAGEVQADHYRYMMSVPGIRELLQKMLDAGLQFPAFQIDHLANFSHGNLIFITYEHFPEMHDIFKRFAKVFEQTYTRFLDLQRAEAQALEAIKRASVDRVRAEIASMRTTGDLDRITPLIWNELTTIGVQFIRCGVFIMDEEQQQVHTYLSNPEGGAIAAFHQPYNTPGEIAEVVSSWRKKEMYAQHWDEARFNEFTKNLVQQGAITTGEKYLTENRPTDLYLHFFPFMQGMLYVGNTTALSDGELQLVQNLADAFSTAYARYEDFNKLEAAKQQVDKTLADLKQAQSQLVQAEKMASLGELTAGIAHEIQNPLNFVNNFSELNAELIGEMEQEISSGNLDAIKSLANDIRENEQKINHHGKRADSIVKGMLQHSRNSVGEKTPTDINALADEYLRLAYHGFRSKDKDCNISLLVEFDNSIGKILVIPQDIGRVLLNLYNNAFYAVSTYSKSTVDGADYHPTVSVITRRLENKVEIIVSDNGNGIPEKVLDKIFQPFFTTKPTGQGTGLGLSLSYDIIKAHGGTLQVESKEGEDTRFIILLAS